jgi:hypothetical protein
VYLAGGRLGQELRRLVDAEGVRSQCIGIADGMRAGQPLAIEVQ